MCSVDPISGIALIASGCNFLSAEAKNRKVQSNCEEMRQLHAAREAENVEREQANLDRAREVRALAAKMSGPEWEELARREQITAVSEERQRAESRMQSLQKELGMMREELQQRELELAEAREQVHRSENETAAVIASAKDKLVQANDQVRKTSGQSAELMRRLQEMRETNRKAVSAAIRARNSQQSAVAEAAMLRRKLDGQRRTLYIVGAAICIGVAAYGAYRLYQKYTNQPAVEGVPIARESELGVGELLEEVEQRERSEFEREEEWVRSELVIRFALA